jgi:hypothetical protein
MEDTLTPKNMQLNELEPRGFTAPGKSLINEVEKLREAVLLLVETQKELTAKVDEALPHRNGVGHIDSDRIQPQ